MAIDELKKVLQIDSTLGGAHVQLGVICTRLGKFSSARQSLLKALSLDPSNQVTREQLNGMNLG